MTAHLIVRADVPEADRKSFDHWYETGHSPVAKATLKASGPERGWNANDPSLHFAKYRFDDLETATSSAHSEDINDRIIEFDRVWQGRVTRSCEVVELVQPL